ncbi:peroxiredoxin-like family protein [Jannaschia sp. W003]|uniref:peroxiredoxin-like family protein n=1 Tax=Jannaschia sp. W003 TaxID=2867012 RepID=UPI0021A8AE09|nr:peroxiredoxin-like family protein [Jannaschia sp. W003]UWQ21673.1 AhpC/TSA family protein [Jannaschia sp. W003]
MIATDTQAPALAFPLLDGGRFDLARSEPERFTLVLFYRGSHCPICKRQIEEDIVPHLGDFADIGVEVVAVSMDDRERVAKQQAEWSFGDLRVGYDLDEATARAWGLYMSHGISEKEPARFSEPAMTLVRSDGRVFAHWQQSTPFARPKMADLLSGIRFVVDKDYPARGTERAAA